MDPSSALKLCFYAYGFVADLKKGRELKAKLKQILKVTKKKKQRES